MKMLQKYGRVVSPSLPTISCLTAGKRENFTTQQLMQH